MAISSIKTTLQSDIRTVWDVVTTVKDYTWRSDLSRTEIVNEKEFTEYTKEGYPTTFTITAEEAYKRWEFDMENGNMKGHWCGIFTQQGQQTEVEFTEDVAPKKIIMKPFVKTYLKKQQTQFIADLEKELKRRQNNADK